MPLWFQWSAAAGQLGTWNLNLESNSGLCCSLQCSTQDPHTEWQKRVCPCPLEWHIEVFSYLTPISTGHHNLGIWLDHRLTFRTQVEHLTSKLKVEIGPLYRQKSCFSFAGWKIIVQSTALSALYYGDIAYAASLSTFNPLDSVYYGRLRFFTGDKFITHHLIWKDGMALFNWQQGIASYVIYL